MSLKEIYLSSNEIEGQADSLREKILSIPVRIRLWDADLNASALIVTDVQNYFLSPQSHAYIPSAGAVVPNIRLLISHFRENQRPVIFTRHIDDAPDSNSMGYWWQDHIQEGSWSSEITKDLDPDNDPVLTKSQYDAFHGTDLEPILREKHVLYPVFCGFMANLCCETTVRSAFVRGFRPVLPLDATAAYNRELHISTFRNLSFGFSPLLTTREVLAHIRA